MLAAASRWYDSGDPALPCLLRGVKPPPSSLALILTACGHAGNGDLLAGVWRAWGPKQQAHRHQQGGSEGLAGARIGVPTRYPARRVVRALVKAAVECDVRAAGLISTGIRTQQSVSIGGADGGHGAHDCDHQQQARLWNSGAVARAVFGEDSNLTEVLWILQEAFPYLHQRQSSRQSLPPLLRPLHSAAAATDGCSGKGQRPLLPLLPPQAAWPLLLRCSSVGDVDLLLVSQLLQEEGLPLSEVVRFMRHGTSGIPTADCERQQRKWEAARQKWGAAAAAQHGSTFVRSGAAVQVVNLYPVSELLSSVLIAMGVQLSPTGVAEQQKQRQQVRQPQEQRLTGSSSSKRGSIRVEQPLFPPALPPPIAAAAVSAYVRHGAIARAAAVAQAARSAQHQDMQAMQRLVAECARAGLLVPALNAAEALRSALWRAPSPETAAALLRCAARTHGMPIGARGAPQRLLAVWRQHGVSHPVAWGALLRGLWEAGDGGQLLRPALLAAMASPVELRDAAEAGRCESGGGTTAIISSDSRQIQHIISSDGSAEMHAADQARSQLLGELIAAMLEQDPGQLHPARQLRDQNSKPGTTGGALVTATAGGRREAWPGSRSTAGLNDSSSYSSGGGGSKTTVCDHNSTDQQAWDPCAPVPGLEMWLPLRLEQQQPAVRRVASALSVLEFLRRHGVVVHDDAALASALQALRMCRHGEDAHASGGWGAGVREGEVYSPANIMCLMEQTLRGSSDAWGGSI